jgi:hypothetical protein
VLPSATPRVCRWSSGCAGTERDIGGSLTPAASGLIRVVFLTAPTSNLTARYGKAWEGRDANAAAALSHPTRVLLDTVRSTARSRRDRAAWNGAVQGSATSPSVQVIAAAGAVARIGTRGSSPCLTARQSARRRLIEFAGEGQCRTFRQWWHRRSPAGDRAMSAPTSPRR